jgi:hypothetical protein
LDIGDACDQTDQWIGRRQLRAPALITAEQLQDGRAPADLGAPPSSDVVCTKRAGSAGHGQRLGHFIRVGRPRACNYLVSGGLLVVLWLSLGSFRTDGLRLIHDTWAGAARPSEFVQDLIGARALWYHTNPYPVLGQGAEEMGLSWPIGHRSTHPPTAFLLVLPLAGLPWDTASGWWMAAMLGLLGLTAVVLGWQHAAVRVAAVSLLWPPAAWSLFQLTPVWLAGLALAWRLQSRPWLAGVAIGVASLSKLLPALALGPFLWRRQWGAAVGFVGVWLAALAMLVLLGAPDALGRYVALMGEVGREQAARVDNAALLLAAWGRWGWLGLGLAGMLVAVVLGRAVARLRVGGALEFTAFGPWVWLTVALLPLAWDYSLLPLLPWLVALVWHGRPLAAILAGVAIALPMLPWDEDNSLLITLSIVTAGLGIAWQAAPPWLCQLSSRRRSRHRFLHGSRNSPTPRLLLSQLSVLRIRPGSPTVSEANAAD